MRTRTLVPNLDEAAEVAVTLADGASTGGTGVTVAGDTVTVTAPGTYRIGGTLIDGTLIVDSAADGLVRLVLDGAAVTNSTAGGDAAAPPGQPLDPGASPAVGHGRHGAPRPGRLPRGGGAG